MKNIHFALLAALFLAPSLVKADDMSKPAGSAAPATVTTPTPASNQSAAPKKHMEKKHKKAEKKAETPK